jgi:hypothetical protein
MTFSGWALAVVGCLRERQFWRETLREALCLITGSSSGLGVALTAAVLGIGHRVMSTACTVGSLQARGTLRKLPGYNFSANTNA